MKGRQSQLSFRRGVRVDWLVDWTNENDCWDYTTTRVRDDIVLKQTSKNKKCCFVDMPIFRSAREAGQVRLFFFFFFLNITIIVNLNSFPKHQIGPSEVFAVHSRGAKWGDLVSAAADCVPWETRIWVDIFAMRQWEDDDDVKSLNCVRDVLCRCKTVLVSWSSDMNLGPYAPFSSLGETHCICEIYLAETLEKNVVLKAGRAYDPEDKKNSSNNNNKAARPFRNFRAIHQSHITVDIRQSISKNRDKLLEAIYEIANITNADEVNQVVNISLKASLAYADWPELLSAACGRIDDLRLPPVKEDRSKTSMAVVRALHAAASGGYLDLIQHLHNRGDISVDIPNESGRTALLLAASYV